MSPRTLKLDASSCICLKIPVKQTQCTPISGDNTMRVILPTQCFYTVCFRYIRPSRKTAGWINLNPIDGWRITWTGGNMMFQLAF